MTQTEEAFLATRLTILFNEQDDRLVALASDTSGAQEGLMLTRRLTARLVNGIAAILEKSNVTASKAPGELRNDIVLMEHQGAIAGVPEPPAGGPEGQPVENPTNSTVQITFRLVSTVNIKTNPMNFQMVLQAAGGGPVGVVLNRDDLHRLLELLKRLADVADWNLPIDAAWLDEKQGPVTVN